MPPCFRFYKLRLLIPLIGFGWLFACQHQDDGEWLPPPNLPQSTVHYLFWTDLQQSSIMRATLCDTVLLTIDTLYTRADGIKNPHGLAVDVAHEQIYWTEYTANRLMRANWSGKGVPEVVYTGSDSVQAPVELTLNTKQGQLYWTEPIRNRIQTAPSQSKGKPRVLYDAQHGVGGAFGLTLTANYLYWTEPNDNQVVRANVNGVGRPTILYNGEHGITEPYGLALDTTTSQLYILDNPLPYLTAPNRADQIFLGNLTGSKVLTSLFKNSSVHNAYSLAIDRRHRKLYWLNQLDPSIIMQGNLDGSGSPREFIHLNSICFALTLGYSTP